MNIAASLLLIATVLTLGLALHTVRRNPFPGQHYYIGMLVSAAWWSMAAAMENFVVLPADKVMWAKLAWPGIVAGPSYWTLFIWAYVKGDYQRPSKYWHIGLLVMPLLTCVIALTNPYHQLMYTGTQLASSAPGAAVLYRHGPWFYICTLYLYGYMALSMLVIINALARANALYRRHYMGFALAMAIPWLTNASYVTGLATLFDFDPTPFSFLLMGAIFYWLISHRQLFDLLPIAHDVLLDAIPDAVLVLNETQKIAQLNVAAQALPMMPANAIGLPLVQIEYFSDILPTLWGHKAPVEFELSLGEQYFDLRSVTVYYREQAIGLLLVLRDITHHKNIQLELKQALISLEEQLESNADLHAKLRDAAIHDPLTGLHNRRFLNEITPNLLANSQRKQQPLSIVMIDLDHFKAINDRSGHAAGDAVLQHVARVLQMHLRQSDFLCRIGGEEFLALLPDTTPEQAARRTESWRDVLQQQPPQFGETSLPITFSAGIAALTPQANDLDQVMIQADHALYQAKAEGRNRSCIADQDQGYVYTI